MQLLLLLNPCLHLFAGPMAQAPLIALVAFFSFVLLSFLYQLASILEQQEPSAGLKPSSKHAKCSD